MSNPPHEAPALTAHEEHPGWRAFLNTRMLICVFLGFTSGLPLFTLVYLVQAWLRSEGVNLKEIGLFALIQFPYTWKFVWAPLMDRYVPRLPGWRPGRRRGWMLVTQILVGRRDCGVRLRVAARLDLDGRGFDGAGRVFRREPGHRDRRLPA